MTFEHIKKALEKYHICDETDDGVHVITSCLYPSFEGVSVFVVKVGDGFHVHDAGNARSVSWHHGREFGLIDRQIKREANRFGLMYEKGRLIAKVQSVDWLQSAILSVANAASIGAHKSVEKIVQAAEFNLQDKIFDTLRRHISKRRLTRQHEYHGASGKSHRFDFAITSKKDEFLTLIDAVTPHHVSISAKYVAFADVKDRRSTDRILVHDNYLKSQDKALLQQVADVLPYDALELRVPTMVAHD